MMHYSEVTYEKKSEGGWHVTAPCGFPVAAPGYNMRQYLTSVLDELTCEKCREIYALEIMAQLP